MQAKCSLSHRFFTAVMAAPKMVIALTFLIIIGTAVFILTLMIDVRYESFLP